MNEVKKTKECLIDISKFNRSQLEQIKMGFDKGLDISWYNNPEYHWEQMFEIRVGLKEGIDVSRYANPSVPADDMYIIRDRMVRSKKKREALERSKKVK